jgi:hypothetical protein
MERRVLVQRSMSPRLIIVGSIRAYDSAQVRFTEYDHVVQALPADRADEPLDICILPG